MFRSSMVHVQGNLKNFKMAMQTLDCPTQTQTESLEFSNSLIEQNTVYDPSHPACKRHTRTGLCAALLELLS
jgi:hypothetical protein